MRLQGRYAQLDFINNEAIDVKRAVLGYIKLGMVCFRSLAFG